MRQLYAAFVTPIRCSTVGISTLLSAATSNVIAKKKRAGQKPYARLEDDIPKLFWASYYLFVDGADGVALVLAGGGLLLSCFSQPVTAPITRPNSMIRVNNRFIVGVTLTNSEKRTSKNLTLFLREFLGYSPTTNEIRNSKTRNKFKTENSKGGSVHGRPEPS